MKLAAALFLVQSFRAVIAEPLGVHVAIGGPDSMVVSWSQHSAASPDGPKVRFGPDPNSITTEAVGETRSYLAGATLHNHVTLSPLQAATIYYYTIFDQDAGEWSTPYELKTVPSLGSPLTFAVFGDLGDTQAHHNGNSTIEWLGKVQNDIDLIWHSGDVGYADDSFLHKGCELQSCYEQVYDDFMSEMDLTANASKVPWMVAPGNHEVECHDPVCFLNKSYRDSLSNFSAYNARFEMPSKATNGNTNMWYSFDAGLVHFVSLDLETAYPGAAEEYRYVFPTGGFYGNMTAWLVEDLKAINRSLTPWVLVSGHHPMYAEGKVNEAMQAALEDILYDYEVDVTFTGHVHHYERDYPVYQGVRESTSYVDPRATVHIMLGGAGNDEMDDAQAVHGNKNQNQDKNQDKNQNQNQKNEKKETPRPLEGVTEDEKTAEAESAEAIAKAARDDANLYVAKKDESDWEAVVDFSYFGAGFVEVHNATHMHFNYIRTSSSELFDDVWIVKNSHA